MESNEDNGQPPDDDERSQEENADDNETPPEDTNDTTPGETNDEHKGDSGQFEPRRSDREKRQTEKMEAYQADINQRRKKTLENAFDNWKKCVRQTRNNLRSNCCTGELSDMVNDIKWHESRVVKAFEDFRGASNVIQPDIVRRVDACVAVTRDLYAILNERLCEIEEFEPNFERNRLNDLKKKDYAQSIFSSFSSAQSNVSERMAEAAADLAVKEAEFQLMKEQEEKQAQIIKVETEYRASLDAAKANYKRFEAKREVKVAEARLGAYTRIINQDELDLHGSANAISDTKAINPVTKSSAVGASNTITSPSSEESVVDTLAKALAKSVNLNRLPIPEPSVFTGDPLQYMEWKSSFETLIERKDVPPEEKLFFLKRYTAGAARKALEGFFYDSSETAYDNAREVLDERYGHPFVAQRAFRSKLDKWPKIGAADPEGLRNLADFLQGCRNAIQHVPSLSILSDSTENQKLLSKLPDWLSARWNREVTQTLEKTKLYPDFAQFVDFMKKEAKVACNPVSSLYALRERDHKGVAGGKVKVLATSSHTTRPVGEATSKSCDCCDGNHFLYKCDRFLGLSIDKKRDFVRNQKLCYGCLRKGHVNKDCKRKHTCSHCKGSHPSCLHEDRPTWREVPRSTPQRPPLDPEAPVFRSNTRTTATGGANQEGQGTSMIVPVWVSCSGDRSNEILTYALLDTQSDTTFILEDLATDLHVPQQPVKLNLSTMTSKNTVIDSRRVCDLEVRGFDSNERTIIKQSYTRNFIPVDRSHIPRRETAEGWSHLRTVVHSLPPLQSCDVGLLIGYNCPKALAPKQILTGDTDEPYAVETSLGWSIVGCGNSSYESEFIQTACHRCTVKEQPICSPRDAVKALEGDFTIGGDEKVSQDDIHFLNQLDSEILQREDKHVEMPLPFKERPKLPNNRPLARLRLEHLKRKLKADNRYFEQYKQCMNDVIERNDAEPVQTNAPDGNEWYIPHHGVYHKKKEKLRVVYDCSARYKGTSLNDHLLTGPDLTNKLVGVLCRFRRYPVAIMCDIEKMFHQFIVRKSDRDFLRFLWWEGGDLDSDPLEYRMRVHLFGAASSPGCANYGLKYLAKGLENELPAAAAFVRNDFYVDDGLTSLQGEQEAIRLVRDAQELCSSGGLHLHKFVSNSKAVIESIPESERAADVKDLDLSLEPLPVERALGIKWCVENDVFTFEAIIKDPTATRRNMLSIVASIFDPIGFLSPFTLMGKRILQEMCQNGVGWDDPIPERMRPEWESWLDDIHNLQFVKITRSLKPSDFGNPTITELHHFSDASTSGYGQVSYIRYVNEAKVHCSMLMSKSRVAPQKVVTIPRLELTAATLSVKMSLFLKEELGLKIDREYFWTDSRVVLGYINNDARRFHVFVANRVQLIREATEPDQWLYVKSEDNPADHASRGLTASGITNSTWLQGPSFLWQRNIETNQVDTKLQLGDPEVKTVRSLRTQSRTFPNLLERFSRISNWSTLVSVVARLQRLSNGVRGTQPPTIEERRVAERKILTLVQHDAFKDSISTLEKSETLSKKNALYPLDPLLRNGLLCVGGRLRKAKLSLQHQHPVILPKDNHITRLILRHVHQQVWHQGRGITLNKLKSSGYWIIGGSKTVANMIRQCVVCRKLRRPTETQRMADLPEERVVPSPPFTYCGMDCFGPFIVKQGRREVKRYGLLLTCMCTRAIHIEMLDDMTTDAFINGLRCFIAIRGAVRQIRSDQGTNFVGARNELEREIRISKVNSALAEKQCEFIMNAPCASHTGGVWERQIKSVRNILDSVLLLCPGRLDDSSLRTLFYEAMAIVNSRPLAISEIDDPNALEPLTPNHILTAKSDIPHPPPGEFVKQDLLLRKRWRRVQYLLEQFWSRWKKEYVSHIALRQKWLEPRRNICVGDVVLVKDVSLPRNQWPLAIVIEANADDDGLVRRVKVKTGTKGSTSPTTLERSVHKVVLLIEQ